MWIAHQLKKQHVIKRQYGEPVFGLSNCLLQFQTCFSYPLYCINIVYFE